jgi:nicotinate (nicotinamide) nucleotide adenylyltransferase
MLKYQSKSALPLYKCNISLNKNLTYGLYGGSFNPIHAGHKAVAQYALKSSKLSKVIWLVTPRNPFKDSSIYSPYNERLQQVKQFSCHSSFIISDIENKINTSHTYQTLSYLKKRYPYIRFSFIVGSDSVAQMHKWHFFKWIAKMVQFIIIVRPTHRFHINNFQAIQFFKQNLIEYKLILRPFFHISSTKIRSKT